MKKCLLLFSLILLAHFTTLAQEGWLEQTSGTTMDLHSVFFVNSNVGWAVGGDPDPFPGVGIILKTTDGGGTWTEQPGPGYVWYSVFFVDLKTGYVAGRQYSGGPPVGGTVAKTTDGGTTWTELIGGMPPPKLYSVCFTDTYNGWTVGKHGVIKSTTDGGTNWTTQNSGSYNLYSVYFINNNIGWAVGYNPNIVLKTTNGGINWFTQGSDTLGGRSVYFVDQNVGWIAGGFYGLSKTTDGGTTWTSYEFRPSNLYSVYFVDQNNGWFVGRTPWIGEYKGIIFNTTDGGENWIPQPHNSNVQELNAVQFIDQSIGWIVGTEGVILKTTTGGVIPVELTSFTASISQSKVTLNWSTATETNNSGFEIQRMLDNSVWERISFVEGHGTTTKPKLYSYVDDINSIAANSLAYRLKQMDFDGSYQYSDEVLVEVEIPLPSEFVLHQNFPNPYNPATTITYSLPIKAQVKLVIYNALGESITRLVNEEKEVGKFKVEFDASSLPSGVYFYRLQAGNFVETKKMLLLK